MSAVYRGPLGASKPYRPDLIRPDLIRSGDNAPVPQEWQALVHLAPAGDQRTAPRQQVCGGSRHRRRKEPGLGVRCGA